MIYLNDKDIRSIGIDWRKLTGIIRDVAGIQHTSDCVHPLKPYLRFGDPDNRIIAMPAYVGGSIRMAGIKWIASFPHNHRLGLPRAHNTMILNEPVTGRPLAFIHSALLSGLRTAAVSGLMMEAFLKRRKPGGLRIGMLGWGPVGRLHLDMCRELLGEVIQSVTLYDPNGIDPASVPETLQAVTAIADDWRPVFRSADIFITCTVSPMRYLDEQPPAGALLLHVSLRDYMPESLAGLKVVVVDDWGEVCREDTDVEQLHKRFGLMESDTVSFPDAVCRDRLAAFPAEEPVLFSPMGLAVFDIAIAACYYHEALRLGIGKALEGNLS
ncbi:2,3-diaminopropionate biosynthesis protein SbnB [Paenibacillus nasutitermitis]|uniref:2,3-diaminopropionate biosynthesis protein SbnB n=1 Tax=Paenibacillus nasutitermitis TaxID=1652958 RepID=A0A917E2Z6_9BACL|nr:2,3-diaminopropionate biosynthesis protein SbnB [Paenibacillus nasutitermitis]GGD97799.1 2,3-diaminopropionate biosynthesis protein SbnB [Paenibacillus nasutitermitis]